MLSRLPVVSAALLLALVLSGCGPQHTYGGTVVDPPLEVPAFTLVDTAGQPFDLKGAAGQITLVFFGYTNCPDTCPLTMAHLKQAVAQLRPQETERVQVVFVTVDPDRDTPEVVGRFVHGFNPSWVGLTGDPAVLAQARKAYGVYGEPAESGHADHAAYEVVHTDRVFALTGPGAVRLIWGSDTPPAMLTEDIRALLRG
ncbi:MAG: SCO family protein [Ardenticatenaceae bacterium]|nr:SCO family protein [Ardenticatenaceae bacterium]